MLRHASESIFLSSFPGNSSGLFTHLQYSFTPVLGLAQFSHITSTWPSRYPHIDDALWFWVCFTMGHLIEATMPDVMRAEDEDESVYMWQHWRVIWNVARKFTKEVLHQYISKIMMETRLCIAPCCILSGHWDCKNIDSSGPQFGADCLVLADKDGRNFVHLAVDHGHVNVCFGSRRSCLNGWAVVVYVQSSD